MARLMLATGGTGGHVFPALAVATVARERGHDAFVLGARGGMEERFAAAAGVPFHGVAAGKWVRERPSPRQAWRALRGLLAARRIVARERPDVAVGFGGFASFPGVAAAALSGTPLVLVEGNAMPGRVTRWFARRAAAVVLAQAETAQRLPAATRTVVTGWPVRPERLPQAEARRRLGIPLDVTLTLVLGGSQGSLALNRLVPAVYAHLEDPPAVLHQTGERWLDDVRASLSGLEGYAEYRTAPFVDATVAWSAADLAITRAGVSTLTEASYHGVPVIAVPLPSSADDHQRHNARAVAVAGAGACVEQDDPEGLARAWRELLDPRARATAAVAARRRAVPDAAVATVTLIEDLTETTPTAGSAAARSPGRRRGDPT